MSRKIDPACFCSCNILIFFSFYQEAKKKYDKETEKYCGILEKHLNLSSKKKESQLQEVRNCTSILNKLFNFTWCCGYVLVTLGQKVLGLEETSETDAWMAFISSHPHSLGGCPACQGQRYMLLVRITLFLVGEPYSLECASALQTEVSSCFSPP